jgi:crotonobetainyl-CoA:carnitine CoA-transferase CaiB-like acyl-CoA transferase
LTAPASVDSLGSEVPSVLSRYRVIDLTEGGCLLAGQILADLGADVIQVEPPGGSPARSIGPFHGDQRDPERSLHWWAYGRGKRSLVLDRQDRGDRAILEDLIRSADVAIVSGRPSALDRCGLDAAAVAKLHPGLVQVSISPFGKDGPKCDWAGTDLTLLAAAGPLVLYGDDDRPPVRVSVPQAELHAATDAALGVLIALQHRERTGLGQHVDVSVQHSAMAATQSNWMATLVGDQPLTRIAGGGRVGPLDIRFLYPARDGFVSITLVFGSAIGPLVARLMDYIHEQGGCDEVTRSKDWIRYYELLASGAEPFAEYERVKQVIAGFTARRTKEELFRAALERGLVMAPVATIADVVKSAQLAARGYWNSLRIGDAGEVAFPGAFARFSGSQAIRSPVPAPRIGEHSEEIRAELRTAPATSRAPTPGESRMPGSPSSTAPPLAGVKIVDLMWVIAGPGATRLLADYGATVVRIETSTRPDACRTLRPHLGGRPGTERSALFHSTNAGKHMLSLDLSKPAGRAVFLDLVRWADVVAESFSPKAMRAWDLDYGALRKVNPDLIMLSSCLMGQTGPHAAFAGFGNLAAAVTGFYDLTGWPDRAPAGPWGAYTDYIAPRYGAIAILAALEHRRRTGEGQYIDLAQGEAALHFLAPAILDYAVNGRVPTRAGNRDPDRAPHGVYPCAGEDRWIAIAVENDTSWRSLCDVVGRPELASDHRYADLSGRLARHDELDALVAAWTSRHDMHVAERILQEHGIAASAVQNAAELAVDPQLVHRGHYRELPHPEAARTVMELSRFHLSRAPARMVREPALTGADNQHVLQEILGYDDERITELVIAGALE